MTTKTVEADIVLQAIKPKVVSFWITGTSPLIMHKWSSKALAMMRMTALERKKVPKTARTPEADAEDATYKLSDGSYAFPMLAFKSALINAAHKDTGLEKTLVRKALFIPTWAYETSDDVNGPLGRLHIYSTEPVCREDIVKVGQNSTDLRYRPQFNKWSLNVIVEIEPSMLNPKDLVTLVNRAGFSVGVLEWRPEKGGEYGRFEFDEAHGMKDIKKSEFLEAKSYADSKTAARGRRKTTSRRKSA